MNKKSIQEIALKLTEIWANNKHTERIDSYDLYKIYKYYLNILSEENQ